MTIKTKAVGVRFPLELIERIERYQNERGVNFTEALIRLVEKGLGGGESETITTSDDKLDERITTSINQVLDSELDKRITIIVNDRLDVMLDELTTRNTLLDDSSNSDTVLEPVPEIQTEAIEQVSGVPESLSWGDFHKLIDSPASAPNKANGNVAITTAKANGHGDWIYDSTTRKFTKLKE